MINTFEDKSRAKTAKDAEAKSKRRVLQAQIVSALQTLLQPDEQLLGFSRAKISGGLRGKLTVGFEALFAPDVNIALTERRVVLQHVQPESGKANEILPHSFPLSDIHSIAFSDIETFGGDPEGRLNIRMFSDQHFRLRFRGADHTETAGTIANVFSSLTASRPMARTSPTQSLCPHCDRVLDLVSRFCPYCGQTLDSVRPVVETEAAELQFSRSATEPGDATQVSTTIDAEKAPEIPDSTPSPDAINSNEIEQADKEPTASATTDITQNEEAGEPAVGEDKTSEPAKSRREGEIEGDQPK